ncbi:Shikimate kinase [Alphaproteobacteria bacterium]
MRALVTKPIVFIGMMGSGKSAIGKRVARKLNLQFYDSDKVIEEREKLSIIDIYDFKGESYFRKMEEEVTREVLEYGVIVLSTGGSTFLNDVLRVVIQKKAISIWLYADIDVLYNRVARRNTRPELICGDKKETLSKLMAERNPIYQQADIVVDSKDSDTHYIVDAVMVKLKKYLLSSDSANGPST